MFAGLCVWNVSSFGLPRCLSWYPLPLASLGAQTSQISCDVYWEGPIRPNILPPPLPPAVQTLRTGISWSNKQPLIAGVSRRHSQPVVGWKKMFPEGFKALVRVPLKRLGVRITASVSRKPGVGLWNVHCFTGTIPRVLAGYLSAFERALWGHAQNKCWVQYFSPGLWYCSGFLGYSGNPCSVISFKLAGMFLDAVSCMWFPKLLN